ncbi:MAG: hypothetical protein IT317_17685 [Anaerolineales bacterium]|nr:hypothetical protein [Anaerolineales bacterium]
MPGFFVYEYVHKEGRRAEVRTVLHRAECRWCREGRGHPLNPGLKLGLGRWHGPFDAYPAALSAADAIAAPRCCQACHPA